MSVLVIDSIVVHVAQGVELGYEDLVHMRPAFSGKMRSAKAGTNTQARAWSMRTAIMTDSAADTLTAALLDPSTVSISGDLIGETVVCEVMSLMRQDGPGADDVRLSFELQEVGT